jgi:hypothetical protein
VGVRVRGKDRDRDRDRVRVRRHTVGFEDREIGKDNKG